MVNKGCSVYAIWQYGFTFYTRFGADCPPANNSIFKRIGDSYCTHIGVINVIRN